LIGPELRVEKTFKEAKSIPSKNETSKKDVDAYLSSLPADKRNALE
jgi:hypothetical protein